MKIMIEQHMVEIIIGTVEFTKNIQQQFLTQMQRQSNFKQDLLQLEIVEEWQ